MTKIEWVESLVNLMITWKLMHHMLPVHARVNPSPYYAREQFHPPFWERFKHLGTHLPSFGAGALLVVYCLAGYPLDILIQAMVFYVAGRLLLLMPSLMYLIIPVATILAPVIAREREQGTWDVLRTTPLSTDRIIMEKAAGALDGLHDWFQHVAGMMIPTSFVIGILSIAMSMTVVYFQLDSDLKIVFWAMFTLGVALINAIGFVIDRAQQCTLMLAAALAASSSRRTIQDAVPYALLAVGGVWLLDVALGWAVLVLVSGPTDWPLEIHIVVLLMFSPLVAYLLELPLEMLLPAIGLTLALRECAIWLIWRWTLHKARTL